MNFLKDSVSSYLNIEENIFKMGIEVENKLRVISIEDLNYIGLILISIFFIFSTSLALLVYFNTGM